MKKRANFGSLFYFVNVAEWAREDESRSPGSWGSRQAGTACRVEKSPARSLAVLSELLQPVARKPLQAQVPDLRLLPELLGFLLIRQALIYPGLRSL